MKRFAAVSLAVIALWSVAVAWGQAPVVVMGSPQADPPKLRPTGAKPSPRHRLISAPRHMPRANIPASFLVLPSKLDIWANDTYGDCVTAEEAFNIAAWSTQAGQPEVFVDSSTVVKWARHHGVLNGADLTNVMDMMASDGIQATDGKTYHGNAKYAAVDYSNYQALCSAIYTGPVKLGMAAGQLQNVDGVGSRNGWFASGFRHDNNEDHCTAVCGYGTASDLAALFQQKGVQVTIPSDVQPTTPCVAYFTWGTVGIMDHQSLVNTTGEAWVRDPSVTEIPAPGPNPPPPPTPTPTPTPTPPPPGPAPVSGQIVVDPSKMTITVPAGWTVNAAAGASVSLNATLTVTGTSAAVK